MKKIYLLLILITGLAQAQIVNIPDANFKNFLLTENVVDSDLDGNPDTDADTNDDGEIQIIEAQAVDMLEMPGQGISDLTGLASFVNLELLSLADNNIATIDLSSLTHLQQLDLSYNQLATLNLTGLTNMLYLNVSGNHLATLSISGMPQLWHLEAMGNQMTNISFNALPSLSQVYIGENQLTTLDVSGLPALSVLDCYDNQLASFDMSGRNLQMLDCGNNPLTSLNLSNATFAYLGVGDNTTSLNVDLSTTNVTSEFDASYGNLSGFNLMPSALTKINCWQGFFESIDVSAFTNLSVLNVSYNPMLQTIFAKNGRNETIIAEGLSELVFVCVDESQIDAVLESVGPGVNVNTYCTFSPGGNYNTITGNVTLDQDGNGCSAADPDFPYVKMNISNGVSQGMTFSRNNGDYTFYPGLGNFTVTPDIENPSFFNINPANVTVNFPNNNNAVSTNNFCISNNGIHNDLEIVITPVGAARPGFDAKYTIVYKNKGNQPMSLPNGIILQYDNNVLDFLSASEPVSGQGTDSLNWDYMNLLPFETRSITVTFSVNAPTDTPPVNINDTLLFTAGIGPNNNDENTADNTFVYTQTVVGSFDPNDITCLEGDAVSPSEIGKYLHYIINFENTGTYPAENIVIKKIIDATKFDLSSLRILTASHDIEVKLTGNVLEMIFKNIQLGPGEHGSILLKIRSNQSLATGNTVEMNADIFFDYNFPIATNIAATIFATLSTGDTIKDNSLSIYPNPASDVININSLSKIKSLEMFDAQGRLLLVKTNSDIKSTLDISNYTDGIYYVRISTEMGIKTEKIIKN